MNEITQPLSAAEARTALRAQIDQRNIPMDTLAKAANVNIGAIHRFLQGEALGPDSVTRIISAVIPLRMRGTPDDLAKENALRAELTTALAKPNVAKPKPKPIIPKQRTRSIEPTDGQQEAYRLLHTCLSEYIGEEETAGLLRAVGLGDALGAPMPIPAMQVSSVWGEVEAKLHQRYSPEEAEHRLGEAMKTVFAMKKLRIEAQGIDTSGILR